MLENHEVNLQKSERMIFFIPGILYTSKPSIKTVSEMQSLENFNYVYPGGGVFLQN